MNTVCGQPTVRLHDGDILVILGTNTPYVDYQIHHIWTSECPKCTYMYGLTNMPYMEQPVRSIWTKDTISIYGLT